VSGTVQEREGDHPVVHQNAKLSTPPDTLTRRLRARSAPLTSSKQPEKEEKVHIREDGEDHLPIAPLAIAPLNTPPSLTESYLVQRQKTP